MADESQLTMRSLEFWGPGEEELARKLKERNVSVKPAGTVQRAVFQDESSLQDCLCKLEELTAEKVFVREAETPPDSGFSTR
ncbi:hypothetical protein ACFQ49_10545 [Kroppenstedtia eburnea]|uniref:Uncharacterized protein n=1 Tax=Kroppenstedtia eburnea TaxID=714067 RepID=A0A1N7NCK9_9BACL|nr:hypothetical protein [Kroppenstedtia eburnea]QKI83073.1 hypothetical protein GXN75_14300 [Kroppenstedtia eburnea]SIS96115.1 hypothetical protein SAMN05421790_108129 [Kroppenstedtia eburnea]